MDLHGHPEPPGLAGNYAEEIVLKGFVLGGGGHARTTGVARIHTCGERRVRRVEIERSQVRGLELDRHGTIAPLALERWRHDSADVGLESTWQRRDTQVAHVSVQERRLARVQGTRIGCS